MRLLFSMLSFFFLINSFSQKNEKLKILLDTIKSLDYAITPNGVIEKNLTGNNIVWAGKIDTIIIENTGSGLELIFYCHHYLFDTVSKELICSKDLRLKTYGDGYFTCSVISNEMKLKDAEKICRIFLEKPSHYTLTIGKVEYIENRFGKKFVNIRSYNFYTFQL
jgi:hypothetical protein